MKKIALMMTTLFALTNIVIPSTATYALEQIRTVESFDESDNLNEVNTFNNNIIEENISEDNAEDKENITTKNVENNVENQEDVEAFEREYAKKKKEEDLKELIINFSISLKLVMNLYI